MATEAEEPRTDIGEEPRVDLDEEEGEGGPVKTFLEHLEDLRWVLIKSFAFLGVAILICLLGGKVVTAVLMRPLTKAKISHPKNVQVVSLFLGTNHLADYRLT